MPGMDMAASEGVTVDIEGTRGMEMVSECYYGGRGVRLEPEMD